MAHALRLDLSVPLSDPRAPLIHCSCGESWSGRTARDESEAHVELYNEATRAGRRRARILSLAKGLDTDGAARAWKITEGAARSYLRALVRRKLAHERRERTFPFRAHWTAA